MIKAVLKSFGIGVAVGSVMFVVFLLQNYYISGVYDVYLGSLAEVALLNILVSGTAFGLAAFLYELEKIKLIFQVLIHYFSVLIAFTSLMFLFGRFSLGNSLWVIIRENLIVTVQFFIVWSVVFFSEKAKEKKLNEALKKYQDES